MCNKIIVSNLPKTWILDLDGTILKHNGYKNYGKDIFLDGALEFLKSISKNDMIIFLTSRKKEYKDITEDFLKENGIKWNYIVYDAPYGERILVNDRKPSGLNMAFALNTDRDEFMKQEFVVDNNL